MSNFTNDILPPEPVEAVDSAHAVGVPGIDPAHHLQHHQPVAAAAAHTPDMATIHPVQHHDAPESAAVVAQPEIESAVVLEISHHAHAAGINAVDTVRATPPPELPHQSMPTEYTPTLHPLWGTTDDQIVADAQDAAGFLPTPQEPITPAPVAPECPAPSGETNMADGREAQESGYGQTDVHHHHSGKDYQNVIMPPAGEGEDIVA